LDKFKVKAMWFKVLTYARIIPVLLICGLSASASQLDIWRNLKNLELEFSENDKIIVSRIEKQKEIADNLISETSGSEERMVMEKAFNELFFATQALFDIYNQYCNSIREKLPEAMLHELERPVGLEHQARAYLDKSEIIKAEAKKAGDQARAKSLYMMAHDLELMALLKKARALRIYQDFPVVYEYGWEYDITDMSGNDEKVVRMKFETGQDKPEEKEAEDAYTVNAEIEHGKDSDVNKGIYFIIQIAAHSEQIPQARLNAIYKGDQQIKMMQEGGWYKYFLGPFKTYEEADRIMKSLNILNVFIAAYSDGQRIGLSEGRSRQAGQ
jgi:hypothetical protein